MYMAEKPTGEYPSSAWTWYWGIVVIAMHPESARSGRPAAPVLVMPARRHRIDDQRGRRQRHYIGRQIGHPMLADQRVLHPHGKGEQRGDDFALNSGRPRVKRRGQHQRDDQ